jgi:hypothetical protein
VINVQSLSEVGAAVLDVVVLVLLPVVEAAVAAPSFRSKQ